LPYGLLGGRPAKGSISILTHADGTSEVLPTMISTAMKAGDRLYHRMAGGGGYGDPLLRDAEAVARDVKNARISVETAKEEYGVLLNGTAISLAETEALRGSRMLQQRS
jgi:N-methylhydantoinase B